MEKFDSIKPLLHRPDVVLEAARQYEQHGNITFHVVAIEEADKAIVLRVQQGVNQLQRYLSKKELISRGKDLLKDELAEGWQVRVRAYEHERHDTEKVTIEWIDKQMQVYDMKQADLAREMGVDSPTINRLFTKGQGRQLTRFQRAAFLFYFRNKAAEQVNAESRLYIEELERKVQSKTRVVAVNTKKQPSVGGRYTGTPKTANTRYSKRDGTFKGRRNKGRGHGK